MFQEKNIICRDGICLDFAVEPGHVRDSLEKTVKSISVFLGHFIDGRQLIQPLVQRIHIPNRIQESLPHRPASHQRVRLHEEAEDGIFLSSANEVDLCQHIVSQKYGFLWRPDAVGMEAVCEGRKMLFNCSHKSRQGSLG